MFGVGCGVWGGVGGVGAGGGGPCHCLLCFRQDLGTALGVWLGVYGWVCMAGCVWLGVCGWLCGWVVGWLCEFGGWMGVWCMVLEARKVLHLSVLMVWLVSGIAGGHG